MGFQPSQVCRPEPTRGRAHGRKALLDRSANRHLPCCTGCNPQDAVPFRTAAILEVADICVRLLTQALRRLGCTIPLEEEDDLAFTPDEIASPSIRGQPRALRTIDAPTRLFAYPVIEALIGLRPTRGRQRHEEPVAFQVVGEVKAMLLGMEAPSNNDSNVLVAAISKNGRPPPRQDNGPSNRDASLADESLSTG